MKGFDEDERHDYRDRVHSNLILAMRGFLIELQKRGFFDTCDENLKNYASIFLSPTILFEQVVTAEIIQGVKTLWADPTIQTVYRSNSELQVDSGAYYFNAVERIGSPEYVPTDDDILRSRARTTGITEICFSVEDVRFRVVDVGGQRSERKKWIHCFQGVTAIIFCVAMNEYDLKLFEDENINRINESLVLFEEICNCQWFAEATIVLFLNKVDLFEQKIQRVDLRVCFPDYTGGLDFKKGCQYLRETFNKLNRVSQKTIYIHITQATDTQNVRNVFEAIKETLIDSMQSSLTTTTNQDIF